MTGAALAALMLAAVTLAIWLYLVFAHGAFWKGLEAEHNPIASPADFETWPPVVAIIPARNEAETLPRCLASLLAQSYPGDFSIVVVDDQSEDGTGDIARSLAPGACRRLAVVTALSRPPGWTGKVWAQHNGILYTERSDAPVRYFLLTDADITYSAHSLTGLVRKAQQRKSVLTSLMAKLNCTSPAERMLVPAFVYFFQMLYPFAYVNSPRHSIAAAAGGCMLVECDALRKAGGLESIRSALIDDCELARVLKRVGPIWLGLAHSVHSIRKYESIGDIQQMVSRSAYAQLRYSPLLLAGTTLGLTLVFLTAPVLVVLASWPAKLLSSATWVLMSRSYQPMLRYYARHGLWGAALPLVTVLYLVFTLNSAYQHLRGRGGMWKGRVQGGSGA